MLDALKGFLKSPEKSPTGTSDDLKSGVKLVQSVLKGMALDDSYQEVSGGYVFERFMGSAGFYIILKKNTLIKANTLSFVSPILKVPNRNKEKFYRRLLELNKFLVSCSLAIVDDTVQIVSERELKGLDAYEFEVLMHSVSIFANYLDDSLSKEFGTDMIALGHKQAINNKNEKFS